MNSGAAQVLVWMPLVMLVMGTSSSGTPGPHVLPQALGDLAVQLADAVRLAAGAQGEDRHGKIIGLVDRRLAQAQEILHVDADLPRVIAEIMGDEFTRKRIVARRDRRVRGENARRRDDLERGAEIELVRAHEMARALQPEERGVTLVHVVNRRFEAQRRQRAGTAHAQDDLLADAHLQVAAVELRGDGAVLGVVVGDVGVEQVEVDAPDGELPDLGEHLTAGQFDGDLERLAVVAAGDFLHGQVVEILVELDGLLDAFAVDLLLEVTVPVEQADGAEVQVEVAGDLQWSPERMPRPPE